MCSDSCIQGNTIYTETKSGFIKQIDSGSFNIILDQVGTASLEEANFHVKHWNSEGGNGDKVLFQMSCNCEKDVVSLENYV